MLFRSIFIIALLINLINVLLIQADQTNSMSLNRIKVRLPLITDEDASQWLSTRNIPHRWRHQNINSESNEIAQTLKKLQALDDNGIRQYDTQSFEGVSMEVIFEMVSKQNTTPKPRYG